LNLCGGGGGGRDPRRPQTARLGEEGGKSKSLGRKRNGKEVTIWSKHPNGCRGGSKDEGVLNVEKKKRGPKREGVTDI